MVNHIIMNVFLSTYLTYYKQGFKTPKQGQEVHLMIWVLNPCLLLLLLLGGVIVVLGDATTTTTDLTVSYI